MIDTDQQSAPASVAARPSIPEEELRGRPHALGNVAQRLERDENEAGIGLAAADETDDVLDGRILAQDGDELRQLLPHRLEGDALVGLDAPGEPSGILLREEALGHDVEEIDVEAQRRQQDEHHGPAMRQRPPEGAVVAAEHRSEGALHRARRRNDYGNEIGGGGGGDAVHATGRSGNGDSFYGGGYRGRFGVCGIYRRVCARQRSQTISVSRTVRES